MLRGSRSRRRAPPSDARHFQRHQGVAGWIYAARNEMHLADVFKLGYTTATPEERVKNLNTEQRNRTSQIGFFELVFARPVIDTYGAEQRLFAAIAHHRVSKGKEFFCLPLDELAAEIAAAAAATNEQVISFQCCPGCGATVRFTPLTNVSHPCQSCGIRFECDARGQVLQFRRAPAGVLDDVRLPVPNAPFAVAPIAAIPAVTLPPAASPDQEPSDARGAGLYPPRLLRSISGVIECPHCRHLQAGRASTRSLVRTECAGCGRVFDGVVERATLSGSATSTSGQRK